jgi:DeoR/GlpR family transcriptional regulator of sugar metabolism
MLTEERKQRLLNVLKREGRVLAKESAGELGVSEDTIRRDLRELAADGLLLRVHGGALPASPATESLASRRTIAPKDKQALARAASRMLRPGQVIFVDGGTTCLELVRQIDKNLRLMVVTHSPTIAAELLDHRAEVQIIGGRLFKHSMVAVGATAAETIRTMRADVFFMGVTGIHAEHGLTTGDAEEAAVKRTIAQSCGEIVVMASTEKIGAVSPFLILPIQSVTHMLVPRSVPARALKSFKAQPIEIVTCP